MKILKESGHQIALVLRMGIASSEKSGEEGATTDRDRTGSCDSLEQPTNQNPPPPPPVDLGTNSIITGSNPEEETDSGVHCPSKDLNQQKGSSTPRTSLNKRKKPKTLPTREDGGEEDDSSVCSSPAIERSGSGKSHSQTSIKSHSQTNSKSRSQTSSFGLRLSMAHIVVVELATVVTIADKVEQLVAVASFPSPSHFQNKEWENLGMGNPSIPDTLGAKKMAPIIKEVFSLQGVWDMYCVLISRV